jgi:membrane-associated phospholipid phosphatase
MLSLMSLFSEWDRQLFYWVFEGMRADWLTPLMLFFRRATSGGVCGWDYCCSGCGWCGAVGGCVVFALLLIPTLIVSNELCDLLKSWVGRVRPCMVLPIEPLVGRLSSPSFPSAHAANMAALTALGGMLGGWRVALALLWLPLLVGLSRVYVGVHYPSDVLGGWLIGGLIGSGVGWLWRWATARRASRPSESDTRGT